MRFRRLTIPRMNYSATNFLVVYFVLGIAVLLLSSVAYISYVVDKLDQAQINQVKPLADLAALIPSVEDQGLSESLNTIWRDLWENSRLSFIIEDREDGTIIKARGVDPEVDTLLDSDGGSPLGAEQNHKLNRALERMKQSSGARQPGGAIANVIYSEQGREVLGRFYYGEVAPERVDQLPFVITDYEGNLVAWRLWDDLVRIEDADAIEIAQAEALRSKAEMERRVNPIQLSAPSRQASLYYEAAKYYELMLMPFAQVLLIGAFVSIGIISYRNKKRNEQAAIWGGLARETAHQLGTPISALMGWTEVIGEQSEALESSDLRYIHEQMQGDVGRLQKINARFGTIGTDPMRGLVDIGEIIRDVVLYFEKRLPSKSRRVEMVLPRVKAPPVLGNQDLLLWVFENLVKNSLDALDKQESQIEFGIHVYPRRKQIVIIYSDNGRGIPRREQRKIFLPGHTTKKHGWGLGLTLAKRIIEDYHHGKIRLADSSPGKTTFEIRLPIAEQSESR